MTRLTIRDLQIQLVANQVREIVRQHPLCGKPVDEKNPDEVLVAAYLAGQVSTINIRWLYPTDQKAG